MKHIFSLIFFAFAIFMRFTLIAIILALMGVFGLVFFETQHRLATLLLRGTSAISLIT